MFCQRLEGIAQHLFHHCCYNMKLNNMHQISPHLKSNFYSVFSVVFSMLCWVISRFVHRMLVHLSPFPLFHPCSLLNVHFLLWPLFPPMGFVADFDLKRNQMPMKVSVIPSFLFVRYLMFLKLSTEKSFRAGLYIYIHAYRIIFKNSQVPFRIL